MVEKSYRKRKLGTRELKPDTLMMGYGYDPALSEGSLKPPQFSTSTFVFKSAEDGKNFFAALQGRRPLGPNEEPGLVYSRFNNPNLEVLEDRLAIWDKAESEGLSRYGHTEYGPIIAKFQDYFLKQGRNGLPPEAIGRLVERLLTQNAPPVRTTILRDKFMQNTLPSLMPKRMVDGIIARMFGLKAKP